MSPPVIAPERALETPSVLSVKPEGAAPCVLTTWFDEAPMPPYLPPSPSFYFTSTPFLLSDDAQRNRSTRLLGSHQHTKIWPPTLLVLEPYLYYYGSIIDYYGFF